MPAYRSKMCCAHREEPVKRPRPTRPKKVLTDKEKEEQKLKRAENKALKEKRTQWETTLPKPWEDTNSFKHREGTLVTFKTDAKKVFGLTERDIITLRYEQCRWSLKQYFALADVQALQQRKFAAGALPSMDVNVQGTLRVLNTLSSGGHRGKSNFPYVYDGNARAYFSAQKGRS